MSVGTHPHLSILPSTPPAARQGHTHIHTRARKTHATTHASRFCTNSKERMAPAAPSVKKRVVQRYAQPFLLSSYYEHSSRRRGVIHVGNVYGIIYQTTAILPSGAPHGEVGHHPRRLAVQVELRLETRVPALAVHKCGAVRSGAEIVTNAGGGGVDWRSISMVLPSCRVLTTANGCRDSSSPLARRSKLPSI